jgi:hypothetical protein
MSIGNWATAVHTECLPDLTSVPHFLSFRKTAIYGRDLALSVDVLAFIFALPSGREVGVKSVSFLSTRPHTLTARPPFTLVRL